MIVKVMTRFDESKIHF